MSHRLIVSGSMACFQRPEFRCDLVSYEVITPIAARGIFEAIHWTPSIRWEIGRIQVISPIELRWAVSATEQQRVRHLADVCYVLEARFELTDAAGPADNPAQHAQMFKRRAKGQRFFRTPYLGQRECAADVRLLGPDDGPESHYQGSGTIEFDWMVFDRDTSLARQLRYYRPIMQDGTIDLTSIDPETLPA